MAVQRLSSARSGSTLCIDPLSWYVCCDVVTALLKLWYINGWRSPIVDAEKLGCYLTEQIETTSADSRSRPHLKPGKSYVAGAIRSKFSFLGLKHGHMARMICSEEFGLQLSQCMHAVQLNRIDPHGGFWKAGWHDPLQAHCTPASEICWWK